MIGIRFEEERQVVTVSTFSKLDFDSSLGFPTRSRSIMAATMSKTDATSSLLDFKEATDLSAEMVRSPGLGILFDALCFGGSGNLTWLFRD